MQQNQNQLSRQQNKKAYTLANNSGARYGGASPVSMYQTLDTRAQQKQNRQFVNMTHANNSFYQISDLERKISQAQLNKDEVLSQRLALIENNIDKILSKISKTS